MLSDRFGVYRFISLGPGTYTVVVTTPPPTSTQTFDGDGLGTPHSSTYVLPINNSVSTEDFGYQYSPTIGDRVWEDRDAD